jgi:hypothetical protein
MPIVNPNLDITPVDRDGAVHGFDVRAVVKGRGRLRAMVTPTEPDGHAFAALRALLAGATSLEPPAWSALASLGVVISPNEVSQPVRFSCSLDTLEVAEIPSRLRPVDVPSAILNPAVRIVPFDELVKRDPANSHIWEPVERLVMVRDRRTEMEYPFWASDPMIATIEQLISGTRSIPALDADLRTRLVAAGIVIDPAGETFETFAANAHARYKVGDYVTLTRLLNGAHIVAMRSYYTRVLEEGFVYLSDGQVPLRYAMHREPLMAFYHHQIRALFETVVGEPIKCSYPYFGAYRNGADLEKHTDREQCEWTASLLIDELPRPEGISDWSLFLELPTGDCTPMLMGIGDGSIYLGRKLPHYRDAFTGQLMTCHFYHYVKADFDGPLD